ncbi:MAG: DUF192 domain-containing protein [Pseudomonadota bacterium]|nr:DUF192 domain-containing protein [Pseudomonadota bacterium]
MPFNRRIPGHPTASFPGLAFVLAALLLVAAGCASAGGSWVELAGQRYTVEVAADDAGRARGLMFRDSLPADAGMLFIHERSEPQAYWMKNTRIALDILYFDDALRLVSQQRSVPPCSAGDRCPPYPSGASARYVLELNAGQAEKLRLEDGTLLRLAPDIHTAP